MEDYRRIQRLKVNTRAIESILLNPSIKDKEVMVIGITGVFRSGKSFTLNLLDNQLIKLNGMVGLISEWMPALKFIAYKTFLWGLSSFVQLSSASDDV